MFYYLYQVKNNLDGKIYVGVHQTKNLNDGYMGSGKVLRNAIHKHGIENFTKVILETFENAEAMYEREAEIVNAEFLKRPDVYNICNGGGGGWEYLNSDSDLQRDKCIRGNKKMNWLRKNDQEWREKEIQRRSALNKEQLARGTRTVPQAWIQSFKGKTHTPEVCLRLSQVAKINQAGEKNSMFGKRWMNKDSQVILVSSEIEAKNLELDGWKSGKVSKQQKLLRRRQKRAQAKQRSVNFDGEALPCK